MPATDRQRLPYQPRFDIRRALHFKVTGEESGGDIYPELPSELIAAASIMATEMMAHCDALLERTRLFMAGLADCVERSFPGEIEAYEEALREGDRHAAALYEDRHCVDIAGSTQVELYILCKSVETALVNVRPYIADYICPVRPIEGTRLVDLEENYYTDLAYREYQQSGAVDRLAVAYEAQLKYQTKSRLDCLDAILSEAESTAQMGYETLYRDGIDVAARQIVSLQQKEVHALLSILRAAYDGLAADGIHINHHNRMFSSEEIMEPLRSSLMSLIELRVKDSTNMLEWLQSIDLEDENSALYELANHLLTGVEMIDQRLDTTMLDLAKSQEAERLMLQNKLQNIAQRKQIRQLVAFVTKMMELGQQNVALPEVQYRAEAVARDMARQTGLCI